MEEAIRHSSRTIRGGITTRCLSRGARVAVAIRQSLRAIRGHDTALALARSVEAERSSRRAIVARNTRNRAIAAICAVRAASLSRALTLKTTGVAHAIERARHAGVVVRTSPRLATSTSIRTGQKRTTMTHIPWERTRRSEGQTTSGLAEQEPARSGGGRALQYGSASGQSEDFAQPRHTQETLNER